MESEQNQNEKMGACRQQSEYRAFDSLAKILGVSAAFLLACMVCLICDYAISRKLSWSLIVAVSLLAAWILLFPLFRAKEHRIRKGLLTLSVISFPYLAVLSILLHVPLLRTMGMCIGALAVLGLWGI